ncbi:hypothetical protein [Winogradskyella costae]|uniref:hypothetical protein n=1 Tax=Winogradskyella costae TaxID=2697008 RepID=UPI0015CB3805|nr:hypothetical protein [Winogradskyella costae]
MRGFFIKSILFLGVILFVIYNIDQYFVEDSVDFRKYFFFYKKPSNSLDAIIIGNSHAHCGLNSNIISAKCNLNTYNLSMAGTNLNEMYSSLKEALKTQTPKLVIVENFAFLAPGQPQNITDKKGNVIINNPNYVYAKKLSFDKIIEADSIFKDNNVVLNSFNIFKYHEVWSDTEKLSSVLSKYLSDEYQTQFYDNALGTRIISENRIKKFQETVFDDPISISKDQKKILNDLIALSKKNNFQLVFTTVPFLDIYYEKTKSSYDFAYNQLKNIISKHKNVSLFDINESKTFGSSFILDEKTNTLQNQHLNYKGQILASNLLANYINKHIDIKGSDYNWKYSPEGVAYNLKGGTKDSIFLGSVNKVNSTLYHRQNKSPLKEIKVSKKSKYVTLEGWMKRKGLKNSDAKKIIAFKGNNNFIYITVNNEVNERSAPWVEERYGPEFINSGYKLKFQKALLEKGSYTVYHILQNKQGECFITNTYKKIIIE